MKDKYIKLPESMEGRFKRVKTSSEPDLDIFIEQFVYFLKASNALEIFGNHRIYTCTKREETKGFPDYLIVDGERTPDDHAKGKLIGIEHTKVSPYDSRVKGGDPLRNIKAKFEKKVKGKFENSLEEKELFMYTLDKVPNGNNMNLDKLVKNIKDAIGIKTKKKYINKDILLWLELDTKITLKLNENELIFTEMNDEIKDVIKNVSFLLGKNIQDSLVSDKSVFTRFNLVILTFVIDAHCDEFRTGLIISPTFKYEVPKELMNEKVDILVRFK